MKATTVDKETVMKTAEERAEPLEPVPPDPFTVDFTENDPENPMNWSPARKWSITIAVSSMKFISVLATISIVPAAPQVISSLRGDAPASSTSLERTLLVSIWELGEGLSPFLVGPLAERSGRAPVLHAGNMSALAWSVAGALSPGVGALVGFRFLNGCSMTALTLAPTMVGDLFAAEERGAAMAVAVGLPALGNFVAPVCGAFVARARGWRWTIWLNAVAVAAFGLLCLVLVRETYAVRILARRAERARREPGDARWRSRYRARVDAMTVWESVLKPVRIMARSLIVCSISLYTGIVYGLSYLILTTITEIMEGVYAFSRGVVGLAFIATCVGYVIGQLFYGLSSDRYIKHKKLKEGAAFRIEHRLVYLILGAGLLPLALVVYGWTLEYHVHWIVPLISTGVVGFGELIAILSTENYLVDAYSIHSASAVAAGVIVRAISGAVFPQPCLLRIVLPSSWLTQSPGVVLVTPIQSE